MRYVASVVMGAVSGFLPVLLMMVGFYSIMRAKDKKYAIKTAVPHIAAVYLFCFALTLVLSITYIPDAYHFAVDVRTNFIPFVNFFTVTHQYILNILLFVPVGFLLPLLWKQYEKKSLTFLTGFLLSLSIELMQMLSDRVTDIDDLLMNTAGTIIGYFLLVFARKLLPKISIVTIAPEKHWRCEPYACFGFAWFSMLFVRPFLSSWLWGSGPR